jgi:drug/metabolite transporter (DMT)-like permease
MKLEPLNNSKDFSVGILFVIISALGFSAKSIFVKLAFSEVPNPILILALRMCFSLPFFFAGIYFQKDKLQKHALVYVQIMLYGILGYYFASIFDFYGLEYVSAGMERIILFTYPTLVVIITYFLTKNPLSKRELLSLFLTYGGIISIFFGKDLFLDKQKLIGALWVFMGSISYAGYLVGSGKLIPVMGASLYTSLAMSISGIAILIHYWIQYPIKDLFSQTKNIYLLSFLMAILSTVIPVFLLSQGIKRIGSEKAAIIGSLGPVSTLYLAQFFLGEDISITEVLGTLVIISGVLLISTSTKKKIENISNYSASS